MKPSVTRSTRIIFPPGLFNVQSCVRQALIPLMDHFRHHHSYKEPLSLQQMVDVEKVPPPGPDKETYKGGKECNDWVGQTFLRWKATQKKEFFASVRYLMSPPS